MTSRFKIFIISGCFSVLPLAALAEIPPAAGQAQPHALSDADRMSLARQFVEKVSRGFAAANQTLAGKGQNQAEEIRRLPEGEELLFNIRLPATRTVLDAPLLGRAVKGQIVLSLRDFVGTLEFPIEVDAEAGKAQGWYIREKKTFVLDMAAHQVTTPNGVFPVSAAVTMEDNDIFVPADELEQWFGFDLAVNIGGLEITLDSATPLPVEERLARRNFNDRNHRMEPPALPLAQEQPKVIDYPFVDVSASAGYRSEGDTGEKTTTGTASILTTGDFAGGTLTTQTQLEKEEKLTNMRVNYKQQSLTPDLLGPLKARRFEVGDVNASPLPLRSYNSLGLGARVTNIDPLRGTLRPSTEIRGTAFPGWDVELYKGDQLLSFKPVEDDGTYVFEDVDLFETDNIFRVVLYGPQGEVREEEVSIPVDPNRLVDQGSTYDVTIAAQNTETYRKRKYDDEDEAAPAITAAYETALGAKSSLLLGVETGSSEGEFGGTAHAGISTTLGGTLYNLDTAIDDNSAMAAELVARRALGLHQIRNELGVATDDYKSAEFGTIDNPDVFYDRLNLNGPFPFQIGLRPRYNLGLGYASQADGNDRINYDAGLSTSWNRISASQQFTYAATGGDVDDTLDSITTVTGSALGNRIRLTGDYEIKPENRLDRVNLDVRRSLTTDLELGLGLSHELDPKLSEATAQVNWNAGFANIAPTITYNTDNDVTATLNTRFGIARDPQTGQAHMYDRGITGNGGVSAFVFLDKDGDNQFNGDDERLEGVILQAPQNGGTEITDEKGEALFTRLSESVPTDIYVDESSLGDPFWIPGFKGASVIPRGGHVTSLSFPVHMAGEMDGVVYAQSNDGASSPLRGITMSLYDTDGKNVASTTSESDGFFLMEKIPPGKYYLTVDGKSFNKRFSRPLPQIVNIGYDGTTIYGKKIYLHEGDADVPVRFVNDVATLNLQTPAPAERSIFVNLGSFKSRLMMGLTWFKVRNMFAGQLDGLDLVEEPSESYPDIKTGQYTLRMAARSGSLKEIYQKCKILSNHGQDCSIDVVPKPVAGKVAAK